MKTNDIIRLSINKLEIVKYLVSENMDKKDLNNAICILKEVVESLESIKTSI